MFFSSIWQCFTAEDEFKMILIFRNEIFIFQFLIFYIVVPSMHITYIQPFQVKRSQGVCQWTNGNHRRCDHAIE